MALETVVFQQDPFSYGCSDVCNFGGEELPCNTAGFSLQEEDMEFLLEKSVKRTYGLAGFDSSSNLECSSSPSQMQQRVKDLESNHFSSKEKSPAGENFTAASSSGRRRRRRIRAVKNQAEAEHQRMTHIALERNRRKQMNDYLSLLRSMMPPSYVQRGDQASIIGGAINFVKELEQMLQSLESHKSIKQSSDSNSTRSSNQAIANIEVTITETHANLKILLKKHPKQLVKIVTGLHSLHLNVLHLNVTSIHDMVLYCFSVKVEEDCQMTSANEITAAVYEHLAWIQ